MTQRNRMSERMRHEAYHDTLTGLPNRRSLVQRLEEAIRRTKEDAGYEFTLVFLDLDRFETYNTNRGYLLGDRLLEAVAKRLGSRLREKDVLARFGGDEFVVLLDGVGPKQEAGEVVDRLLKAFEDPYLLEENQLYVSASARVTLSRTYSRELENRPEDPIRGRPYPGCGPRPAPFEG